MMKRTRTLRGEERYRDPGWLHVASRPWTAKERRVVLHGFFGRLSVAIEPLFIAVFFSLLPIGLFLFRRIEIAVLLSPIFAVASLAFFIYAIVLMVPSARALLETFQPIRTVDGYVRYRRSWQGQVQTYHVAVLDAERQILAEWPLAAWPESIGNCHLWPAVVEFSELGGIHRIDGRSTGVLPDDIPALGIGVAQSAARRRR